MAELLSFTLLPFITLRDSLQLSFSEMTKSLIFWSNRLRLNIIDGNMDPFLRQRFRGEGDIQFGKVDLYLYNRYGSK